jgi:hypothetical protein
MVNKIIAAITIPAIVAIILWLTAAPTWTWAVLAVIVLIEAGLLARSARIDAGRR